jgi:uncharacterized iron-regulated membrane protein
MGIWSKWIRDPQSLWLRKAVFQIHLWIGIAIALYVIVICLTGSILVYRNELYGAFAPTPDDPMPLGFRATSWLLDLHDNLLSGETGRRTNGAGAAAVTLMGLTGLVVWWPGVRRWRRSLFVDMRSNWRQVNWSVHSATGLWFAGFILLWGVSGLYLSYPAPFNAIVEYFFPADEVLGFNETADRILFWFGYSHFGRFGGRIPGCSRGACNEVLKAVWAAAGIAPVIMAVTGVIMWWNRTRRRPRSKAAALVL